MGKSFQKVLLDGQRMMLRPLVRYCLRNSLRLQDLVESAKQVFVEVGQEELTKAGKKSNVSRLSIFTGVHKQDISRLLDQGAKDDVQPNISAKVITQWRTDERFTTSSGKPRVLGFRGDNNEFAELVASVNNHIMPGTVLFDLERIEAVERTKNGLKLLRSGYVPSKTPTEGIELISRDVRDLMAAGLYNIEPDTKVENYHANVEFDNIDAEDLPEIRKWFFKQCSAFHDRVERYLAKKDLDLNPNQKKSGGKRVTLGIFSRTTD